MYGPDYPYQPARPAQRNRALRRDIHWVLFVFAEAVLTVGGSALALFLAFAFGMGLGDSCDQSPTQTVCHDSFTQGLFVFTPLIMVGVAVAVSVLTAIVMGYIFKSSIWGVWGLLAGVVGYGVTPFVMWYIIVPLSV